jgi:hypothetical protein
LTVELSNTVDRIEKVNENIPVEPGTREMVLLYPEWIPGDHEPSGPIASLAGMVTTVDGKRVQWVRDRVNMYAFHVPLSAGAKTVGLDFDYLSPIKHPEAAQRMEIRYRPRDRLRRGRHDQVQTDAAEHPAGFSPVCGPVL